MPVDRRIAVASGSIRINRHVSSAAEEVELVANHAIGNFDRPMHSIDVAFPERRKRLRRDARIQDRALATSLTPGDRRQAGRFDIGFKRPRRLWRRDDDRNGPGGRRAAPQSGEASEHQRMGLRALITRFQPMNLPRCLRGTRPAL